MPTQLYPLLSVFPRSMFRRKIQPKINYTGPAQDGGEGNRCVLQIYHVLKSTGVIFLKKVIKEQDFREKDCELESIGGRDP